ncbi:DinB family protein [Chryseolinea lacunae]|uniref:DinB family protein n=1 Tax=Chryseolinea lacunae TaxID=2801331 RepID=A0ABS1KVY8_9BACT|nr:DinB family protein [Chryseolinea lacunae]MBL0743397.1 DinB family protein [Chryseolinea lacunae]
MKTVFDKPTRDELIRRIDSLSENDTAQWGKMSVYQMAKHCALWEEMVMGTLPIKRAFIGYLFGRLALKQSLKDDKPMGHNAPTSPKLLVKERHGDLAAEKKKWKTLLEENAQSPARNFVHPFFGTITTEQLGYHAFKHIDHHLRQFNR